MSWTPPAAFEVARVLPGLLEMRRRTRNLPRSDRSETAARSIPTGRCGSRRASDRRGFRLRPSLRGGGSEPFAGLVGKQRGTAGSAVARLRAPRGRYRSEDRSPTDGDVRGASLADTGNDRLPDGEKSETN